MSNRVIVVRTKFENMVSGDVTYGYRIADDYESEYNNVLELEDVDPSNITELEFLRNIVDTIPESIMDYMKEYEKGICIDDSYFEWDEIKDILLGEEDGNFQPKNSTD